MGNFCLLSHRVKQSSYSVTRPNITDIMALEKLYRPREDHENVQTALFTLRKITRHIQASISRRVVNKLWYIQVMEYYEQRESMKTAKRNNMTRS